MRSLILKTRSNFSPSGWTNSQSNVRRSNDVFSHVDLGALGSAVFLIAPGVRAKRGETEMKLCITSQGTELTSLVDPRFGRATVFVIMDSETKEFMIVDNKQNLQAAQGAGIQAAQNVVRAGAKAVITGHCGPKAYSALKTAGLDVFTGASGQVAEALEAWKSGKLAKAESADVEGHW